MVRNNSRNIFPKSSLPGRKRILGEKRIITDLYPISGHLSSLVNCFNYLFNEILSNQRERFKFLWRPMAIPNFKRHFPTTFFNSLICYLFEALHYFYFLKCLFLILTILINTNHHSLLD